VAIDQLQGQLSTDQLGEMGGGSDAVVVDAAGASSLVIPGGSMLLVADFAREGPDLIVEGPNGEEVIVRDHFTMENLLTLQTEGGAQLTSELVSRMAGTAAPQQFASDGALQPARPIGTIETQQGTVTAIRADGSRVTLQQGDQVYQGDVIETGGGGGIGMTFADGTTFSLGEEGRMVLDELIYDPETDEGKSAFSVIQGAFSFVSGAIAKSGSDAMTVRTPVATIGVRGMMVVGTAAQEGEESSVTLLQEEGGITGEIVVTNQAGSQVLNVAFQTTTVNSFFSAPTEPVVLPQSVINNLYGNAVDILPEANHGTSDDTSDDRDDARSDEGDRSDAPTEEGEGECEGGNNTLRGGDGNDIMRGDAGNDLLKGGDGADVLYGGEGADNLQGQNGVDLLYGDGGNDVLTGGEGADTLNGGSGADTYQFNFTSELDDTITSFGSGDMLAFDGEEFVVSYDEQTGLIDESEFVVIDDFDITTDTADSAFVFDSNSGALYYDQGGGSEGYTLAADVGSGDVGAEDIKIM